MDLEERSVVVPGTQRYAALAVLVACVVVSGKLLAQPTITKSFNPTGVQIGQTSSLTFTINNPATSPISAVAFTDTFPTNLFVATPNNLTGSCGSGTITATAGSGSVSLAGGTIPASGSCTFAIDVIVLHQNTNAATGYTNTTGNVTASSGAGNTATDTLTASGGTFAVAKGFSPNSISPGGVSTLTFTLTSSQATAAFINQVANVVFQDVLPAGVVVATPNGLNSGTCSAATITATAGSGTITLGTSLNPAGGNTGGLNFGASGGGGFDTCSFSVDVTAASAGTYLNTVTQSIGGSSAIVSNNGNNGSATLSVVAAVPPSPPSIAKAFNPTAVQTTETSTLTLTITNPPANSVSLTGVAVTDNLPAGLVVATPSNLTSDCGGSTTAVAGSGVVSLSGGTIAASAGCIVTLDVAAATSGLYNNTTDAVSSTNGGTGNTASAALTVVAPNPPSIAKAFSPTSIQVNGTSTLTLTITNPPANAVALTGVAVTDTLPGGLVVATPSNLTNSCGGSATAVAGSGSVALTGGTIPVNSNCAVTVDVTAASGGSFNNTTGAVSSTIGGTGNSASSSLTVIAPPAIAKAFNPSPIVPGAVSTLTVTITNPAANTVALTGLDFTDNMPAGLVVANPNNLANTCGGSATAVSGTGTVSLTGGSVAANSNCTVTVLVTAALPGTFANTIASVTSSNGGTSSGGASASITVQPGVPIPAGSTALTALTALLLAGLGFFLLRSSGT